MADVLGPVGKWTFLTGFWAAVFSSMLGVWQGVPYIFSDFVSTWRLRHMNREAVTVSTTSYLYRGYLVYLAIPPMLLLAVNRPVWIVLVYAVVGALFMPFLAGTLLVMNNRLAWLGELRNGKPANALLALALILFLYLAVVELVRL
jgi:hypothetical protein